VAAEAIRAARAVLGHEHLPELVDAWHDVGRFGRRRGFARAWETAGPMAGMTPAGVVAPAYPPEASTPDARLHAAQGREKLDHPDHT
jgi:hypothetical protein